jgi:hypothetical protein
MQSGWEELRGRKALRRRIDGSSDRELAVALLATIAIGGPLLAFFTYLFPHPAGTDFVLPTILFCAAILSGVVLWVRRDTVGWPMIRLGVALGAAVITAVMISVPDRSAAYLAYYVWLGVFAFYFLRPAWALATAGWIAALYATAVAIDSPSGAIELWINGAATVLGVGLIVLALRTRIDGLVRSLESEAATDDLTGLPNRRAFDEQLARELRRAHRDGGEVALALLDLDRFKQLNDSSGHLAGDRALRVLADVIRNEVRGMDWPPGWAGTSSRCCCPAPTPSRQREWRTGCGQRSRTSSPTGPWRCWRASASPRAAVASSARTSFSPRPTARCTRPRGGAAAASSPWAPSRRRPSRRRLGRTCLGLLAARLV